MVCLNVSRNKLFHIVATSRSWAETAQSVIATVYGDRIPVWARFSMLVQTGPRAQSALYRIFARMKRPGRGFDHPPPYSAKVNDKVELYFYPPLSLRGLFKGELYFYLYYFKTAWIA
jgi:hypothetical protein